MKIYLRLARHLECIGCCVVMTENHQPLGEPRDPVLRKLLIDEVAGQRLDGLEGEVRGVGHHPVLGQPHLELEGDLGPSAPTLRHLHCPLTRPLKSAFVNT